MTKLEIYPREPIHLAVNELLSKHKVLFGDDSFVENMLTNLQNELLFMLSSCVKYKTGRIELKSEIVCDASRKEGIKESYESYVGPRDYQHQASCYYYITRSPGIRFSGSHDANNFELLEERTFFYDGDIFCINVDDEQSYMSRLLHLNRLRDLTKEQKYLKVNPENVEVLMQWMEVILAYKNDLLKFCSKGSYWSRKTNIYAQHNAFSFAMSDINVSLSMENLKLIDDKLFQLEKEKIQLMDAGERYVKDMEEYNKNFRIILKLKKE